MLAAMEIVVMLVLVATAVAVFPQLVLTACAGRSLPHSLMLIPFSFASRFGVCILIGVSANPLGGCFCEPASAGAYPFAHFTRIGVSLNVILGGWHPGLFPALGRLPR